MMPPGGFPGGAADPSKMSNEQLSSMLDMMKQNPDMMKSVMKSQGMDISDDQIKMMTQFMTPDMMRMASSMKGENGGMPGGMHPGMGMGAGGAPDPSKAAEMMKDPNMIKMVSEMMKSGDENSPLVQMINQ
jgi:hypothetical protein